MTSTTVNGFSVIPVTYSSSATHYLYVRKHIGSKDSWPDGRTLFLVNVPPDATEREIIILFKPFGTVESVSFDLDKVGLQNEDLSDSDSSAEEEVTADGDQPPKKRRKTKTTKPEPPKVTPLLKTSLRTFRKSGRSAHVVFLDSSSLDRCIAASHKPRQWPTSPEEPLGFAHYLSLYDSLRPPLDNVRAHADSAIELYDYELAKTKQKSKYRKGEAIVDEDGFILVTRGGAYGQTLGGGVGVATKAFQETGQTSRSSRNRKKEGHEKAGFYAFQKAEKQRNGTWCSVPSLTSYTMFSLDLLNLKKKWEEDKANVEKLKASRRFRPY